MCRCEMSARVDGELEDGVLAVFNGMKFKYNDLVDVIVGTGLGVRGNKTEPFKGHFKGVCETVRGEEFLVKPLVSGNGRSLQIPRHSVFKIRAFGTCVLGRTTRFFSKLKPALQERYPHPNPNPYPYPNPKLHPHPHPNPNPYPSPNPKRDPKPVSYVG